MTWREILVTISCVILIFVPAKEALRAVDPLYCDAGAEGKKIRVRNNDSNQATACIVTRNVPLQIVTIGRTRSHQINAATFSRLIQDALLTPNTKSIILIGSSVGGRKVGRKLIFGARTSERFEHGYLLQSGPLSPYALEGRFLLFRGSLSLSPTIYYSQERQFCLRRRKEGEGGGGEKKGKGYAGHTGNDTSETPACRLALYSVYIAREAATCLPRSV